VIKTLDRYVLRSFLISALLFFVTLMSLRVVADLFVNMDEFTKKRSDDQDRTLGDIARDAGSYYGAQSILYFRQLGGVAITLAAAFTLAWMNHTNELTAMLASGVSLRRVLVPVIICAAALGLLIVLDTELMVPRFRYQLMRDRDESEGKGPFQVRLVADQKDSCLYSKQLDPKTGEMYNPLILLRDHRRGYVGRITSPRAVYDTRAKSWIFKPGKLEPGGPTIRPWVHMKGCRQAATTEFVPSIVRPETILAKARANPRNKKVNWKKVRRIGGIVLVDEDARLTIRARWAQLAQGPAGPTVAALRDVRFSYAIEPGKPLVEITAPEATYEEAFRGHPRDVGWALTDGQLSYASDLSPSVLTLRQSGDWLQHMSTADITRLLRLERVPDRRRAVLLRQSRIADFFNNILMLLLVAPFVLSRERNIKTSALSAVGMGIAFFVTVHLTRGIAFQPVVAAWLPMLIFGPVAVVMLDSVKT
jgi:lipopolysaccharide export LptBFGC system permease protein LptF